MRERSGTRLGYPNLVNPPGAAGGRTNVVAVRLTDAEAADMDAERGSLNRSEYLRLILMRDRKRRAGVE